MILNLFIMWTLGMCFTVALMNICGVAINRWGGWLNVFLFWPTYLWILLFGVRK